MRSKSTQPNKSFEGSQTQAGSLHFFKAAVIGMFYWNPTSTQDVQATIAQSKQLHTESQKLIKKLDMSLAETTQEIDRLQQFK